MPKTTPRTIQIRLQTDVKGLEIVFEGEATQGWRNEGSEIFTLKMSILMSGVTILKDYDDFTYSFGSHNELGIDKDTDERRLALFNKLLKAKFPSLGELVLYKEEAVEVAA
jgi:hypothetical protein